MSLRDTRNTLFSYKNRFNLLFWLTAPLLTYLLTDLRVYMVGLWWRSVVKTGRSSSFVVEQQSILAQLTMSHLNHVTHLSIDQWPTWPVTRDPVPSSCREHNVQLRWDYKYSAWWRFNINFIHLTRCQTRDWYHHSRTAWLTDNRNNNKHVTKWPTDTLTHWPSVSCDWQRRLRTRRADQRRCSLDQVRRRGSRRCARECASCESCQRTSGTSYLRRHTTRRDTTVDQFQTKSASVYNNNTNNNNNGCV